MVVKPDQARAMRKADAEAEERRRQYVGEALAAYDGDRSIVVPHLIPTEDDCRHLLREVRQIAQHADQRARGPRRSKKVNELMLAIARLVFVERVLAIDDLARAALTPADLWNLSHIAPSHLQDRVKLLNGQRPDSGLVLP